MRAARPSCASVLLLALAGCGAPEPAPSAGTPAGALPRETPELGRPRPKLLPPEAAAGTARSDRP